MKLIVGLGNPGGEYEETRHNIGFKIVKAIAQKQGFVFRRALNGIGELAQGSHNGQKVALLMPLTYMNTSGTATRLFADYFKIVTENVLVIVDDIYLPFGKLRLKDKGSAGGHNGLKSIESHLGTQNYCRLKIGVGEEFEGDLAEHVLSKFTPEEQKLLPQVIENGVNTAELWISQGLIKATQFAGGAKIVII